MDGIKKLTKEEIEKLKTQISKGGRKSELKEILDKMEIGEWIELEKPVNRGNVSKLGKSLGKEFSVHIINGKMYIERRA